MVLFLVNNWLGYQVAMLGDVYRSANQSRKSAKHPRIRYVSPAKLEHYLVEDDATFAFSAYEWIIKYPKLKKSSINSYQRSIYQRRTVHVSFAQGDTYRNPDELPYYEATHRMTCNTPRKNYYTELSIPLNQNPHHSSFSPSSYRVLSSQRYIPPYLSYSIS